MTKSFVTFFVLIIFLRVGSFRAEDFIGTKNVKASHKLFATGTQSVNATCGRVIFNFLDKLMRIVAEPPLFVWVYVAP